MKCPSCGAEITSGKSCEFCGAQITPEMLRTQELLNKQGCPKCSSTNIQIKRENQGEVRNKSGKTVLHQTVAICKDCGNTWYPNGIVKPRKTWLWVLGWIFIFPLPLTLILLKKKEMKPALKYGIIAAAWIVYLLIAIFGAGNKKPAENDNTKNPTTESKQIEDIAQDQSFLLSWNQLGAYGEEKTLNANTEDSVTVILFYIPAGKYQVTNKGTSGTAQVTVYSGIEFDGQWDQFISTDCDKPIVVSAGEEAKTITVKEGQFVKLSDKSENIQFVLEKNE